MTYHYYQSHYQRNNSNLVIPREFIQDLMARLAPVEDSILISFTFFERLSTQRVIFSKILLQHTRGMGIQFCQLIKHINSIFLFDVEVSS